MLNLLGVAVADVFVTWATWSAEDLAVAGAGQGADRAVTDAKVGGDGFRGGPGLGTTVKVRDEPVDLGGAGVWDRSEIQVELRGHFLRRF